MDREDGPSPDSGMQVGDDPDSAVESGDKACVADRHRPEEQAGHRRPEGKEER